MAAGRIARDRVNRGDRRIRVDIPAAATSGMSGSAALALRVIAPVLTRLLTLLVAAWTRQVIARIIPVKYADASLADGAIGIPDSD